MNKPLQSAAAYGYDSGTFRSTEASPQIAARVMQELFRPSSVVDIGCGIGQWLREFKAAGVTKILGIDGPWVPFGELLIRKDEYLPFDFTEGKINLDTTFDLAICLEVAEHLPESNADSLVEMVASFSETIVFSAAVPGQGGYLHVNEQWPSFWMKKFARQGFQAFDLIRPALSETAEVDFFYKQNALVYLTEERASQLGFERSAFVPDIVHPELFGRYVDTRNYSLREIVRHLPHILRRAVSGR